MCPVGLDQNTTGRDHSGFSYTYTIGEINGDNTLTGALDGDELRDIPQNVASLRVGFENANGWNNYVVAKYIDSMCVSTGCNNRSNQFDQTESLFVTDVISRYAVNNDMTVYVKVQNLFDKQSIVARSPHGARPNKPQTASVGIEYLF